MDLAGAPSPLIGFVRAPMGDWQPGRAVPVSTPGRTYTLYRWTIAQNLKDVDAGR